MIGYTIIVLVSTSYSRCYIPALSSCFMTRLPHVQWTISSWLICIYNVDTLLYFYTLPLEPISYFLSSLCLSAT